MTTKRLAISDHNRDIAGLKYVYPVMSRRSGGLSIGINFNTNNACNWRCIYCQVPGLTRGAAPELDSRLLEQELRDFLDYVKNGRFYDDFEVAPAHRVIKDIAISGNGEPTSLKNFDQALRLIAGIALETGVFPGSKFVLITNGSLMGQAIVQRGLSTLASNGGEVWFKIDSGSVSGRQLINDVNMSQEKLLTNLTIATSLCATKLQTCLLHYRGAWSDDEKSCYLSLLSLIKQRDLPVQQIMLYSIARASFQAEAAEIHAASKDEMLEFAADIKALGFDVSVNN